LRFKGANPDTRNRDAPEVAESGVEHVVGPEGGILMPIGVEHAVRILEDYTVINCKDIVPGFSVYHAGWQK